MARRAAPRSLADDLRMRDDASLARLLRARPDLALPVPHGFSMLAARATGASSVNRALDGLDAFTLAVARELALLGQPATSRDLAASMGASVGAAVGAAVEDTLVALTELIDLALVWGDERDLRLVNAAREALVAPGENLSHPAVEAFRRDPAGLNALIGSAGGDAMEVLRRLTVGNGIGRIGNALRAVTPETARSPVDWLLAHGLIVPMDSERVVLPVEVRAALLGEGPTPGLGPAELASAFRSAPLLECPQHPMSAVDAAAGQSALTAISAVAELLDRWSVDPPGVLRSGGLAVRDLAGTARAMDLPEATAALLIEVAFAAGLLASDGEMDESFLPTPAYDVWLLRAPAVRWTDLAITWLTMTRQPNLCVEQPGVRVNALSPDGDRAPAPAHRATALQALGELPPGSAPLPQQVVEAAAWHAPRRASEARTRFLLAIHAELEFLGITGRGALSTAGRLLLEPELDPDAIAAAVAPHLPEPVDHVLLQADLTAIAPGPLTPAVAAELGLAADLESKGGASVYRFSADSIRRALDAGRTAGDLMSWLAQHSRTPVPQPLEYLVEDAGRRHGIIRVGAASAYIRADDPGVLDAVVADRAAARLRPIRLAPTVIACDAGVSEVLRTLRTMGLAPAAESADGAIVIRRPDSRRTPPRTKPPRLVVGPPTIDPARLTAAVQSIRATDTADEADPTRGEA